MENKKISELNSANEVSNSDYFVIVQNGTNKKVTKEKVLETLKTEIDEDITEIQSKNEEQDKYIQNLQNKVSILENTVNSELSDGQATGESIAVNDSARALAVLRVGGNTKQETLTGKNLINLEMGDINSSSGEETTASNTCRSIGFTPVKLNQTIVVGGYLGQLPNIRLYDANKEYVGYAGFSNSQTYINTNSDVAYFRIRRGLGDNTLEELNNSLQLEYGTEATSYEPYCGGQPSPNPDYEQEVQVVKPEGIQLFDKDNPNILNAYFDSNHTSITSSNTARTIYLECEENKTYTISKKITSSFRIGYTTELPIVGTTVNNLISGDSQQSKTYTTGSNAKYLCVFLYNANYDTNIALEEVLESIKIEKGETVTSWSPYGYGNVDMKVSNRNLFDEIMEQGQINTNTGLNTSSNTVIRTKNFIKIPENITRLKIIRSIATGTFATRYYDKDQNFISAVSAAGINVYSREFIIPEDAKYIRFVDLSNNLSGKFCLTSDLTQEDYIAHEEQNITLNLPEGFEMCKIGDSVDGFVKDLSTGKWYKNKKINKKILNGTENWRNSTVTDIDRYWFTLMQGILFNYQNQVAYCNLFTYEHNTRTINKLDLQSYQQETRLFINFADYNTTTINDFKTWLSTNKPIVYYVLVTPVLEEITDTTLISELDTLYEIQTYYGQTNVTYEGTGLSPIFTLDYKKSSNLRLKALEEQNETILSKLALLE